MGLKAELKTRRIHTNYSVYVEHFEHLAHLLAKEIIEAYEKRINRVGDSLGHLGKRRIREYVLEKMVVTATAKVSMKELDKLFPEEG